MNKSFVKKAEEELTTKKSLKHFGMNKKTMLKLLVDNKWKISMREYLSKEDFSAKSLLEELRPIMDYFSHEPKEGWLEYICSSVLATIFPDSYHGESSQAAERGKLFFLENYRMVLQYERELRGFSPVDHIELLDEEDTKDCITATEYDRLREFWNSNFIYEFMAINREITPFNTLGHIGGVHHVAMFVGRQLLGTDIPIDIALLSGAAAGHDLGKFGCKPEEASRVPYLHYYYTDKLLKGQQMPMIAHIASNHSTWDLELENLSVESLLLIYADFRVKSSREKGKEIIHFYTLDEAFSVILHKLDNVDEKKAHRYERVYAKLKDFENYLQSIGVETDIDKEPKACPVPNTKSKALMIGNEVIENLKYTAIEHNIKIMSIFNNESSFASLLEAARSEKKWKSMRAYLNILEEYSTYMTKQEKLMSLNFLYELLSHREGDIRRQAGNLMGVIIASYDEDYRKELPESAQRETGGHGAEIWKNYLHKIVFPDYKVTDQHRSWIGYTLKSVIAGLTSKLAKDDIVMYMRPYFQLFNMKKLDDSAVFVLLDSATSLPDSLCTDQDALTLLTFASKVSMRENIVLKIGALRVAEYISREKSDESYNVEIRRILANTQCMMNNISVVYLAYKILRNIGDEMERDKYYDKMIAMQKVSDDQEDQVSGIFRENLKVNTPWVVKAVNIDFLLEHIIEEKITNQYFHLATHFSNLVKVSERVTVRHRAGDGLIKIAQLLPIEQLNEIVIELTKGLEIGEYQFSKYIPEYLGELALYLYPTEFDELIDTLGELIENNNDKIGSVALDTVGEILRKYSSYKYAGKEAAQSYEERKTKMLGLILKGMSNYHEVVSQEAFMVMGQYIFGSHIMSMEERFDIFKRIYKKMLNLIPVTGKYDMSFYTNAAALNHIYRFISEYIFQKGKMELDINRNIAFFPGTFDPFSLSHKGIVQAIRKEGFDVYLAIDEFSWSKKTQPRMIRRKIISMSVADEPNVFLFPDDVPINIANPRDLKKLRELFPEGNPYIVVGSDVIENASSYKARPEENSIHTFNHIVFKRESSNSLETEDGLEDVESPYSNIMGEVKELTLPVYLEDISSTRIRENIDNGRDISNLIDSVAQNYIYDNSLYLREPQYKNILETKKIAFEPLANISGDIIKDLVKDMRAYSVNPNDFKEYIDRPNVKTAIIRDKGGKVCAMAAVNNLSTSDMYEEFKDLEIASYLREKATGRMLIIRGLYCSIKSDIRNILQILMTEVLADAASRDITYAIYHPLDEKVHSSIQDVLNRQGFREINIKGRPCGIYEVKMKEPIAVIENMDTVLKSPFNADPAILDILSSTHADLQRALTKMYPGNLVLSFNAGLMHQKIVEMVTKENNVPNQKLAVRQLGECMCVPFGKILRDRAVPNTVTKTLHTEKVFSPTLDSFTIEEYPNYATIDNQIKTIKSFNRPVILVDDLLHKGYRMQALDPVFKDNDLEIRTLITGLLSGRGRDLMSKQGRNIQSAYFLPNLKAWFVESTMCPFIGGDGVQTEDKTEANLIPSINQMLPFAMPVFLKDSSKEAIYNLSVVCLENAEKIFKSLEKEYQDLFKRKLTIKSLSDAIISPRMPNGSNRVAADFNLSPSVYMEDYLERLIRLETALK